MSPITHLLKVFSGIGDAIGWSFTIILFIGLVAIVVLIGTTVTKLKRYGCKRGFAEDLKSLIKDSDGLYKGLCEGQIASEKERVEILGHVFDDNGNLRVPKHDKALPEKSWLARSHSFLLNSIEVSAKTVIESIFLPFEKMGKLCGLHSLPKDSKSNVLFYSFLKRLISRPVRSLDEVPSLQSLSVEFATIGDIQRRISMQKNISSVLPAVGLFGTLMGMFSAFTGTNFNDPNMQNVMTGLMMDFGTALWTTILAVLIKILSDLWCNLSLQRRASILMTELMELKYYIFDIIEQSPAICSVVSVPTEEPTLHKPAEVPESPLQTEE